MKDFAYYAALPDSMTVEKLEEEFVGVLGRFDSKSISGAAVIKPLLELSDRQWHAYSLLNISLKTRVEKCLVSMWNGQNLDLVRDIISVMALLGLEEVFKFLSTRSKENVSPEVLQEILSALSELGGIFQIRTVA